MRISDWSSDVCSSDLDHHAHQRRDHLALGAQSGEHARGARALPVQRRVEHAEHVEARRIGDQRFHPRRVDRLAVGEQHQLRSEEHTSELQSLMRISYAVFCLKKKNTKKTQTHETRAKS